MDDDQERLAGLLHEELCGRASGCRRWDNPESGHQEFYRDRARVIIERLEPEIGIASVCLAVRVIIGEVL